MAVKKYKPTSAARRFITTADFSEITKKDPEKSLLEVKKKHSGRNNNGHITTRHKGGGVPSLPRPQLRDEDGPPGTARALHHVHAVAGRQCVTWLQARPYLSARAEAVRARPHHLPPHRQPEF